MPILYNPLAFDEKSFQQSWNVFVCRYLPTNKLTFLRVLCDSAVKANNFMLFLISPVKGWSQFHSFHFHGMSHDKRLPDTQSSAASIPRYLLIKFCWMLPYDPYLGPMSIGYTFPSVTGHTWNRLMFSIAPLYKPMCPRSLALKVPSTKTYLWSNLRLSFL